MEGIYLNTDTYELFRLPTDWPDYDASSPIALQTGYVIKVVCVGVTDGEFQWLENQNNDDEEPMIGFDFAGWIVSGPAGARYKPGTQV